jgi:hypothetical protein
MECIHVKLERADRHRALIGDRVQRAPIALIDANADGLRAAV